MALDKSAEEIKMDETSLFREEIITDRKVGTIRVLHPIKSDGTADERRQRMYVGETQIMTPMGALPLAFQLESESLSGAIEKFAEGAQVAVERAMTELQQMRREAASSIVIPEGMPPGLAGGGATPGGGKIKLP
ncbi:MAG TPA: hypothetical protein VMW70_06920 [Burkholderiales bacterium]|nr:hypothetical protein [Burkholderiales bacterium]